MIRYPQYYKEIYHEISNVLNSKYIQYHLDTIAMKKNFDNGNMHPIYVYGFKVEKPIESILSYLQSRYHKFINLMNLKGHNLINDIQIQMSRSNLNYDINIDVHGQMIFMTLYIKDIDICKYNY